MAPLTLHADAESQRLTLAGDWRLSRLEELHQALLGAGLDRRRPLTLDGADLIDLDSAGAMLLIQAALAGGGRWEQVRLVHFAPSHAAILALVAERHQSTRLPEAVDANLLHRLGELIHRIAIKGQAHLAFFGEVVEALGQLAARPRRFRHREFFVQLESVGLEAIPIVLLMTLLIGMVFTYLLGIQVEKYGANIFIVDGVSLAMTRELAPLLAAILLAGRSGAAFTAQIGAMRVAEEVDAITTLGLSPVQVLVVPRLLAIVLALPLLTFLGDVMGLIGSAFVAARQLDITWYTFFHRLSSVLSVSHVMYGLAKAPCYALAIEIGRASCRERVS
jgi:phospholipid/cholesterol/gamma-HCH transport system permease protein